ncbi:MAG: T9SS type A sorting domain-containing protein [Candidatus Kapabacteria bacterium]|jgi:photosystem II stability/assembly factor-like uncharacterized protein|nr:T9SS type A sorting domain-containing protein [Candidatus Kapabacteria bacterium]
MRSCFVVVCLLVLSFGKQMLVAQELHWEPSFVRFDCRINLFATSGQTLYAGASDNLYRSDDSGKTWRGQLNNLGSPSINAITDYSIGVFVVGAFVSSNGLFCNGNNCSSILVSARTNAVAAIGNILFIGTGTSGVLRRTNSGWSPYNVGLTSNISVLTTSGSILYAGSPLGMYRTLDSGLTWSAINRGLADTRVQAIAANSSFVFAATEGGIFRSQDSGTTWMAVNTGLTERNVKAVIIGDGAVFLATSTGTVFRSTDNGVNWIRVPFSFQGSPVLSFGKLQNMIFAGTREAGIFRSADNGVTWQQFGDGLTQRSVSGAVSVGSLLLLSRGNALYSLESNGKEWKFYANMPGEADTFIALGKTMYAYRRFGNGMYQSDNLGKVWERKDGFVNVVSMQSNLLFSWSVGGVLRSSDTGKTLQVISYHNIPNASLFAVPNSRILFALSPRDSNSKRSADNGFTWSNFNSARFSPYSFFRQGAAILAATPRGLQRSDDDGATWRVVGDTVVSRIQVGTTLYAAISGSGGFLRSNDNGMTWAVESSGLPGVFIDWFYANNGTIIASTSLGLFQAILPATITSAASVVSRSSVSSHSSFIFRPNPVTNQTTLQLDLASTTPVTMLLYNTLGQCVLLRELGTLPEGAHDIMQDMSNIPRGAYTLVVQAGSERLARQLRVMP